MVAWWTVNVVAVVAAVCVLTHLALAASTAGLTGFAFVDI